MEGWVGFGDPRGGGWVPWSRSAGGQLLEHRSVIGSDEPIVEAFALEGQLLGGDSGVLQLIQDEGAQEDLAARIEAALGFSGAIELGKLGLELGAPGLQGFYGLSLALIDLLKLCLNFRTGGHGCCFG